MTHLHLFKLKLFLIVLLALSHQALHSENLISNKIWHDQLKTLFNTSDPNIGTNADVKGTALLQQSSFKNMSIDDGKLFFDFGNNVVNAAVTPRGAIQRGIIFSNVLQKNSAAPAEVWCTYEFSNICRFERFGFSLNGKTTYINDKGLHQQTRLIHGALPITSATIGDLKVKQIIIAPYHQEKAVRGILVGFYIETNSSTTIEANLLLPKEKQAMGQIGRLAKWTEEMPEENIKEKTKNIKRYGKVKTN